MRQARAVVQQTALWSVNSGSECLLYALQQVGAIPHLVHTIKISPHTRKIFAHGSRITLQHLLPLVVAHATHQFLQRQVGASSLINDSDWLNTVVGIPMTLISIAMTCFHYHHMLAVTIKSAILVLDHKKAFHNASHPRPSAEQRAQRTHPVCRECSSMRFIKGEVRSYIAYFFMLGVIGIVSSVLPRMMGKPLAFLLSCQLYGELFLEYRLADEGVCDRHRDKYFRQNPELSISLGAMLALACWAVTSAIESQIGIQQDTLDFGIKSLFSLFFLGLTYHMPLPAPIKQSDRWLSPLSWLRAGVAFAVDLTADGVKKQTKQLLRQQRNKPLELEKKIAAVSSALSHPYVQKIKPYVIPKFLRSLQDALQDSVLKNYVSEILQHGIDFAAEVKKNKEGWKLKLVKTTPLPKSWRHQLVGNAYGGSRTVGELILALLGSKEVLDLLDKGALKAQNLLRILNDDPTIAAGPSAHKPRYVAAPPQQHHHHTARRLRVGPAMPGDAREQWQLIADITGHPPAVKTPEPMPEPSPAGSLQPQSNPPQREAKPAAAVTASPRLMPEPRACTVAGVEVNETYFNEAYKDNPFGAPSPT
ncbi:MAG: hypothetical protein P1U34_06090 [Coxiellaceae bacterium]|nr:hypothetical protein [Coxiellaceae bacterium]